MSNTLWDCDNAVIGGHLKTYAGNVHGIICKAGYPLSQAHTTLSIKNGKAMEPTVCQG
ncbi:hypothetical protein LCGC14_0902110, partial [marine sediment metagenome]